MAPVTDEQLLIHLAHLRSALAGDLMQGLPREQVLRVAALQVDLIALKVSCRLRSNRREAMAITNPNPKGD